MIPQTLILKIKDTFVSFSMKENISDEDIVDFSSAVSSSYAVFVMCTSGKEVSPIQMNIFIKQSTIIIYNFILILYNKDKSISGKQFIGIFRENNIYLLEDLKQILELEIHFKLIKFPV